MYETMTDLVDARRAAAMLGLKLATVRKYTSLRILPFYKIGAACRYSPERLAAWIAERSVEPLPAVRAKGRR